jgi:hypothetical protein
MQTILENAIQVCMARNTGISIAFAGPGDHVLVGRILIRRLHAIVTIRAGDVAMYSLRKLFRVD